MDSAELLAQLADIHMPAAVSMWPPAPGWWALAALLVFLLLWVVMRLLRSFKQRKICAFALEELNTIYRNFLASQASATDSASSTLNYINDFNSVLRRVALWNFPEAKIASLGGKAWVDFIREKGESAALSEEISRALSEGRFMTRCDVDVPALNGFGRQWITSLYLRKAHNLNSYSPNPTLST